MEINPAHDIVAGIRTLLAEKDTDRARDLADLLFETALLTSGFQLESPKDYATKVFTLMKIALGYDVMPDGPDGGAQPAAAAASSAGGDSPASGASSPSENVETVTPEVVGDNPWDKK